MKILLNKANFAIAMRGMCISLHGDNLMII